MIIAGLAGVYLAIRYRWVCDDAFISFRYAQNFAAGDGLVYNWGEPVEGYTNFLWTVTMAIPIFFGQDPVLFSQILGVMFFAGQLAMLYLIGRELADDASLFVPVAGVAWSLHHHAQIFATSGLETSMFIFFILAGTFFLVRGVENQRKAFPLFVLATLTRPDGILFYSVAALTSISYREFIYKYDILEKLGYIFRSHSSLFLILLPYWIARTIYYGWPLPNTFYAKSGDASYWSQGFRYLLLYFSSYYVLIVFAFLIFAILLFGHRIKGRSISWRGRSRILLFLTISSLLYISYYTKVGGDFMFGRFYLPVTPLLLLVFEFGIHTIRILRWRLAMSAMLAIGTLFYHDPYRNVSMPVIDGITDEYRIYRPEMVRGVVRTLEDLAPPIRDNRFRVAIGGSEALFAFYLNPVYVLETTTGLTDEGLAHTTVAARGAMVGHEKKATIDYLYEKGIHLHFYGMDLPGKTDYNVFNIEGFSGEGRIIIYDAVKMKSLLNRPNFHFVNFERYLDHYLEKNPDTICRDYRQFRRYYFDHNIDDRREAVFRRQCEN